MKVSYNRIKTQTKNGKTLHFHLRMYHGDILIEKPFGKE
jgi:hypothetical protein